MSSLHGRVLAQLRTLPAAASRTESELAVGMTGGVTAADVHPVLLDLERDGKAERVPGKLRPGKRTPEPDTWRLAVTDLAGL